jgi:hypothetical protein
LTNCAAGIKKLFFHFYRSARAPFGAPRTRTMASLLDEWTRVSAADSADVDDQGGRRMGGSLSPGAGGGGIGLPPLLSSDEEDGPASGLLGSGDGGRAEPDIFALDPVEREVTR